MAMRTHGHRWRQATVSELEAGKRGVTVDELISLAACLGVAASILLPAPELRTDVVLALCAEPESVDDWTAAELEAAQQYLDALIRRSERRHLAIARRQVDLLLHRHSENARS
jgi:hypothetical protein